MSSGGRLRDEPLGHGEVSFTVNREIKDQKFTTKYKAKVDGDTMKGTVESTFGGKDMSTLFVTTIEGHLFRAQTQRRGCLLYPY